MKAKVQTKTKYRRLREFNRPYTDFERNVLTYLDTGGPSTITQLILAMETNHCQMKRILEPLIKNGFVTKKSLEEIGLGKTTGGGRPKTIPAIGRLRRLSGNVRLLIIITPLGREYLKKSRKLAMMLNWELRS